MPQIIQFDKPAFLLSVLDAFWRSRLALPPIYRAPGAAESYAILTGDGELPGPIQAALDALGAQASGKLPNGWSPVGLESFLLSLRPLSDPQPQDYRTLVLVRFSGPGETLRESLLSLLNAGVSPWQPPHVQVAWLKTPAPGGKLNCLLRVNGLEQYAMLATWMEDLHHFQVYLPALHAESQPWDDYTQHDQSFAEDAPLPAWFAPPGYRLPAARLLEETFRGRLVLLSPPGGALPRVIPLPAFYPLTGLFNVQFSAPVQPFTIQPAGVEQSGLFNLEVYLRARPSQPVIDMQEREFLQQRIQLLENQLQRLDETPTSGRDDHLIFLFAESGPHTGALIELLMTLPVDDLRRFFYQRIAISSADKSRTSIYHAILPALSAWEQPAFAPALHAADHLFYRDAAWHTATGYNLYFPVYGEELFTLDPQIVPRPGPQADLLVQKLLGKCANQLKPRGEDRLLLWNTGENQAILRVPLLEKDHTRLDQAFKFFNLNTIRDAQVEALRQDAPGLIKADLEQMLTELRSEMTARGAGAQATLRKVWEERQAELDTETRRINSLLKLGRLATENARTLQLAVDEIEALHATLLGDWDSYVQELLQRQESLAHITPRGDDKLLTALRQAAADNLRYEQNLVEEGSALVRQLTVDLKTTSAGQRSRLAAELRKLADQLEARK